MSDEALINTLVLTWRREQRLVRVLANGLRLTQFALLAGYLFFAIIQKRMDPFYFLMHLFIVVTGASQFMVLAWAAVPPLLMGLASKDPLETSRHATALERLRAEVLPDFVRGFIRERLDPMTISMERVKEAVDTIDRHDFRRTGVIYFWVYTTALVVLIWAVVTHVPS